MASASVRGDPYTPSSVRQSLRNRTPPSRDEREGYLTLEQAGRGGGRVGVVDKRPGGSKTSPLSLEDSFLSSQQPSFCDLRSEPDASSKFAEEGEKGEGGDGEDGEMAGAGACEEASLSGDALLLLSLCTVHVGLVLDFAPCNKIPRTLKADSSRVGYTSHEAAYHT